MDEAVVKSHSSSEKGMSVRTKTFVCGLLPSLGHSSETEYTVCCTVGIDCKAIEVYLGPSCRNQHVLPRFERQLKYHGRISIKSSSRYSILCEVQGQAGNERCPSDYHEEW